MFLGASLAGFRHIVALEQDADCCRTLITNQQKHHSLVNPNMRVIQGDIQQFDLASLSQEIDLLSGDPPCQPFSIAGRSQAYGDKRDMFPAFAELLAHVKPRAFICENVAGLMRASFHDYFSYILLRLQYPAYSRYEHETWEEHAIRLSAASWSFPHPTHGPNKLPWLTLGSAIQNLPLINNEPHPIPARIYLGHTGSALDLPSKTIKAGTHGAPGGENMIRFPDGSLRYMTVREAARIQTFTDDYEFCGSWSSCMRQIGNAVPVELARASFPREP